MTSALHLMHKDGFGSFAEELEYLLPAFVALHVPSPEFWRCDGPASCTEPGGELLPHGGAAGPCLSPEEQEGCCGLAECSPACQVLPKLALSPEQLRVPEHKSQPVSSAPQVCPWKCQDSAHALARVSPLPVFSLLRFSNWLGTWVLPCNSWKCTFAPLFLLLSSKPLQA